MPEGINCLTAREAAEALGCSVSTVRQRFRSGKLSGETGPQPHRPRLLIHADDQGRPLDADGRPLGVDSLASRVAAVEGRLDRIEGVGAPDTRAERFREAALLLRGVVERQQKASALQSEAIQELEAAVAEQSNIILTLLIGDTDAASLARS